MSTFASSITAGLKIASLDLCADEYALLFAKPAQLVSVSYLGAEIAEFAGAERARGIHLNDGSLTDVLERKPDIILTSRSLTSGATKIARRLGIRIHHVPYASSPQGVADEVERLSRILQDREAVARWRKRYAQVVKARPVDMRRALWISAAGTDPGDTARAWLALAGITPIDVRPSRGMVEQIAGLNVDLVIESNYRRSQWHRGGDWRDHPLVRRMKATKVSIDGRAFTCAGPSMIDSVAALQKRLS